MADIGVNTSTNQVSHVLLVGGFCTLLAASAIARASPEDLGVMYWIVLVVCLAGVVVSGVAAVEATVFPAARCLHLDLSPAPKPWSFWQEEASTAQGGSAVRARSRVSGRRVRPSCP